MAADTPALQPAFSFLKKVFTSQSHSMVLIIFLVSRHNRSSSPKPGRGPSAAIYKRFGLTFFMASNTRFVVSGRLKIINRMADLVLY